MELNIYLITSLLETHSHSADVADIESVSKLRAILESLRYSEPAINHQLSGCSIGDSESISKSTHLTPIPHGASGVWGAKI